MTPRATVTIVTVTVADHLVLRVRTSSRGTLTALILGGYLGGVALAAGGLVLAGVRIGRKIA